MRRVAGRGEGLEPEHRAVDRVDVLLRDRRELAPERVERVAVEPARALLEPLGLDEVRRADRRDVHLQAGVLADEHARRAGVVEVDVREQEMADVGEREPRAASPPSSASTHVVGPQSSSAGPSFVSRR